jgi:hypothetical protein
MRLIPLGDFLKEGIEMRAFVDVDEVAVWKGDAEAVAEGWDEAVGFFVGVEGVGLGAVFVLTVDLWTRVEELGVDQTFIQIEDDN